MENKTLYKCIFGAALLLLAACTQDELAEQGNTLPEGKYPLQIGSVSITAEVDGQPWSTGAPQTRVSESDDRNSSHWDWNDTEQIGVQIEGSRKSGIYKLTGDKTVEPATPVYWEDKQKHKIRAWYPAGGNVDLSKQTAKNGLAYALYAETTEAVDYNTQDIALLFEHKLAKVRVVLEGEKKDDVTDVKIKTCTSCTLRADGTLAASNAEGYISMVATTCNGETCWEANVVPGHEITQVKVNGSESTLTKPLTPLAAKINTITLKVNKLLTPAEPIMITDDGEYTITGSGDQTITIKGNPTVTLDGVTITNDNIPIRITGGNPTLIITGETTLTTTNNDAAGIQLEGESTHVKIQGNGTLKIACSTGGGGAGIGSAKEGTCGNISIDGITATISSNLGAGIGGGDSGHCGNIKIENANLTISRPAGAAAIGCGAPFSAEVTTTCGNIEITNSDITATVGNAFAIRPAAIGCCGVGVHSEKQKGSCGNITITLKSGQEQSDFLSKLTIHGNVEKVGLGGYDDNLKGKVGTITWKKADGTIIGTPTPARDL